MSLKPPSPGTTPGTAAFALLDALNAVGADGTSLQADSTLSGGIGWRAGPTIQVDAAPYKADSTGATDASAAWNAAIAALPSSGGEVHGRSGATYKISSPIVPRDGSGNPKANVTIDGHGCTFVRGGTNIIIDSSGAHATTTTTSNLKRFKMRNVWLDGNGATGGSSSPLWRSYYSVEGRYDTVRFTNYASVGLQCVEAWDHRYYDLRSIGGDGDGNGRPVVLLMSSEPQYRTRLTAAFVAGTDGTMSVNDASLFPSTGTSLVTLDDGVNVATVSWTGKTSTSLTGVTVSGSTATYPIGQSVWGPDVTSGMGHSTDNTNNQWFEDLHMESFRDGGVWIRGASGRNVNKCRVNTAKLESRMIRNRAHLVFVERGTDIGLQDLNTDTGQFDTVLAGQNQAVDHVRVQRSAAVRVSGGFDESIGGTAGSARTYLSFNNIGDLTLLAIKFSAATGNPTVAAVEFGASCNRVAILGVDYNFNPSSVALWSGVPATLVSNPVKEVAGAVSDASFDSAPLAGTLAVDSTNGRLYVKYKSGAWHFVALT